MLRALATSGMPFVALCVALSGCAASCEAILDVRNCRDECDRPASVPLSPWDDTYAMWPHLADLVNGTSPGDHQHAHWTHNQAQAFWQFMGVPQDQPDKQVFLQKGDEVFRVRVLAC